MGILPIWMSLCLVHVWYPQRLEKGIKSPRTGVTYGCGVECMQVLKIKQLLVPPTSQETA